MTGPARDPTLAQVVGAEHVGAEHVWPADVGLSTGPTKYGKYISYISPFFQYLLIAELYGEECL